MVGIILKQWAFEVKYNTVQLFKSATENKNTHTENYEL